MDQIAINILSTAAEYLLLSMSFAIIFIGTRTFYITHAFVITICPFFALALVHSSFSLLSAFLGSIAVAALLGTLLDGSLSSVLSSRSSPLLAYLVASLGLYIVLQNILSLIVGDDPRSIGCSVARQAYSIMGTSITFVQLLTIISGVLIYIGLTCYLRFTHSGKMIRAVSSNASLVSIYGIRINAIFTLVFFIGSAIAGLAGLLSGMDSSFSPNFGFDLLLYGVIVTVLAGIGSIDRLIVSSLLFASFQHIVAYLIDPRWMQAAAFILFIAFLIWKPLGLSGKKLRKIEI